MTHFLLVRFLIYFLTLLIIIPAPVVFANKWKLALPGYKYNFPSEHRSHPNFKIEWWYFSGNVKDESGNKYSFMLTFFRRGLRLEKTSEVNRSRWALNNLYFSHFSFYSAKKKINIIFQKKLAEVHLVKQVHPQKNLKYGLTIGRQKLRIEINRIKY